ncbi:8-oxo-dGTP diphosphatase MutT [Pseudoalteromonas xiamenensis]|uniref:8-oxo-dGTP diphosphatase n=1 Tax=Pseudoalteromonas xiamenensis TaxID=882626 RepID=A0A975DLH8_9GAMM|nr:8-oxo-dGTP diphosphatase MutT [Pseudoalteromonas xiamenensis]QTH72606.1 8-oxo-dGTP diphosphatase MutT [Pseudoalteromonas xiamenensis]WMN61226.1 8-oxo-dGTP diphosphatase MutT [Pseudoalteromonas xiamenensis]
MSKKQVNVAVGVVEHHNQILICKRSAEQHQGGLWEFPGGKIEQDESVFDALKRELKEEVDITIQSATPLITIDHDYGDKCVSLKVLLVQDFIGEAKGLEGQPLCWVDKQQLSTYEFPEANKQIIAAILK